MLDSIVLVRGRQRLTGRSHFEPPLRCKTKLKFDPAASLPPSLGLRFPFVPIGSSSSRPASICLVSSSFLSLRSQHVSNFLLDCTLPHCPIGESQPSHWFPSLVIRSPCGDWLAESVGRSLISLLGVYGGRLCMWHLHTRGRVSVCVGACSRACAFALGLGFASMPASPPPPSSEKSAASSIRPCCITLIGRPVGSPFGSPCIQRWGRRQPASRRRRRLGCRERWSRRRHPVHSLCVAYPNMLEQGADGGTHTHIHTRKWWANSRTRTHTHTNTHQGSHTQRHRCHFGSRR